MKRDVYWQPEAEEELADIWLKFPHRVLITRAAFRMDQRLELDAEGESESREEDVRIILEAPLGALFSINHTLGHVRVLHVWKFGKRRKNN